MSQTPQSQASLSERSQGGRSIAGTSDPNTKSLAEKAVYWILAHSPDQAPIKYIDLKKYVFPGIRVDEPLRLAKEMLSETFGYDLVELNGKWKTYVLVNKVGKQEHILKHENIEAYQALLAIVLGYIFMNRQPVEEKQLVAFLEKMEISIERTHSYFGNVKELIFTTFIKDQYLNEEKNESGTFLSLGERFQKEVDPRALLKFVSKMCGEDENIWKAQWKDIEEMEAAMVS